MEWPADFHPSAPREAILTTWDAFVDELWRGATSAGATLVTACFPRAYIDVNRAADDIDPELVEGEWPTPLTVSDYSRRGMGLIRRHALPGVPMYSGRLPVAAIQGRIDTCYRPYRAALAHAIDRAHARFGTVVHVDAHSMKSRANAMNVDHGAHAAGHRGERSARRHRRCRPHVVGGRVVPRAGLRHAGEHAVSGRRPGRALRLPGVRAGTACRSKSTGGST